jgi:hypothetical protein
MLSGRRWRSADPTFVIGSALERRFLSPPLVSGLWKLYEGRADRLSSSELTTDGLRGEIEAETIHYRAQEFWALSSGELGGVRVLSWDLFLPQSQLYQEAVHPVSLPSII